MLNALFISSIRYWINLLTGSLIFFFNFALIGKCLEFDNSRTRQPTSISLCFEIRSSDALLPGDPECSDPRYVSHDLWTADTCREGSPPHSFLSPAVCLRGCPSAEVGVKEKVRFLHCPSRSRVPLKHSCSVSFYYCSSFHMVYFALRSFHNCLILFKDSMEIQEKTIWKLDFCYF